MENNYISVTLFMAAIMIAFISQIIWLMIAGTALCALYAYFANDRRSFSLNSCYIFIACCFLFFPAFINIHHDLSPVFYFLSTLATFFAAMAASHTRPIVLIKAFRMLFWLSVAGIGWVLYTYWGYPEPFGMVIEGSSTNGIPAYLIVLQISLSLVSYLAYGRLPILSTFVTFAVAFFGNGRGSLVIAAFIIAATLFLNLFVAKRTHSSRIIRIFFWMLFGTILFVGFVWGADLFDLLVAYTKLSVGLVDGNRLEIWTQYSQKLNAFTLLFGADYIGTVIDYEYFGNPHIAFIRTHSLFGLPLTLIALTSPLFVFFAKKTLEPKLVFFIFISAGALRATSEPLFFPTLLDFFYFMWFFIYLRHTDSSRIQKPIQTMYSLKNV